MDVEDETHLVPKPHLNRKHGSSENLENPALASEPWSILTIWLMVIPSIIRILIMVIINPYEPLDD